LVVTTWAGAASIESDALAIPAGNRAAAAAKAIDLKNSEAERFEGMAA
jgi:hypothetical protein